jgi:hypothetical protein
MSRTRAGFWIGWLCAVCVLVWALGRFVAIADMNAFRAEAVVNGIRGLWTAQALALCFFVRYDANDGGWRESLAASLVLILTPLPLLAIGWLMGAAEVLALMAGVLLLVAGSALLMLSAHGVARLTRGGLLSHNLLAFLQIMGGSVVVTTRSSWLGWTGL